MTFQVPVWFTFNVCRPETPLITTEDWGFFTTQDSPVIELYPEVVEVQPGRKFDSSPQAAPVVELYPLTLLQPQRKPVVELYPVVEAQPAKEAVPTVEVKPEEAAPENIEEKTETQPQEEVAKDANS